MNKLQYLLDALNKGSRLADAETWKSRQVVTTIITGVVVSGYAFASAMGWVPEGVSEDRLLAAGASLGALVFFAFNTYATIATTSKIGIKKDSEKQQRSEGLNNGPE